MQSKKVLATLLVPAIMFITSATAFAETTDETVSTTTVTADAPAPTDDTAAPTDVTTATAAAPQAAITPQDEKLSSALAETYSITVTAQEVANLHATSIGYGEISKAYGFSSIAGISVTDVLSMKETMGWGEIASTLGVKVSDVTKSDKAVQKAMNKNTEKNTEKNSNTNQNGNKGNGGGKK